MPKANNIIGHTHTVAQAEAVTGAMDAVLPILRTLLTQAAALKAAIVALPHENEEGERVTHGANLTCMNGRDRMMAAAVPLFGMLSRKEQEALLAEFNLNNLR